MMLRHFRSAIFVVCALTAKITKIAEPGLLHGALKNDALPSSGVRGVQAMPIFWGEVEAETIRFDHEGCSTIQPPPCPGQSDQCVAYRCYVRFCLLPQKSFACGAPLVDWNAKTGKQH